MSIIPSFNHLKYHGKKKKKPTHLFARLKNKHNTYLSIADLTLQNS